MLKKQKSKSGFTRTAYSNAVRLLALREHSEQQLRTKLSQREFDELEIEQAIEQLKDQNYLSDERFAESYLRSRQNKLYGPVRIRLELLERGVDEALISTLFESNDANWYDIMQQAYQRKYGDSEIEDYNDQAKRCRYLQNRGFESSRIMQLVDVLKTN